VLLIVKPYFGYCFGSMGHTLASARATEFFSWFHLEETERVPRDPGELVRHRPSGEKFRTLCSLEALTTADDELVSMELVIQRSFVDGPDAPFARDVVKSFLAAALPDACRHVLEDFMAEITRFGGDGDTPGMKVFKGRQQSWSTLTGWSRLQMANLTVEDVPSLVVNISPNPEAPNAKPIPANPHSLA